jgi:hypothetical protein
MEKVRLNRQSISGKCFINLERKKLSEALQTQKRCMGFATVGYGEGKRSGSPHCNLSEHEKDCHIPCKTRLS